MFKFFVDQTNKLIAFINHANYQVRLDHVINNVIANKH